VSTQGGGLLNYWNSVEIVMDRPWKFLAVALTLGLPSIAPSQVAADPTSVKYAHADRIFANYVADAHVPGLVYGIVVDGQLVHVGTYGVQDLESKRPVTRDSLFRVASMTKAFTALTVLKLRDDGRVRLDAPASDYVPELRTWQSPTDDSPPIRVRDLLNHVGGFVTDDPWGDRQTPMPEAEFTQLLRAGVPFTSAPQTRFEYSNLGYALLGRIITKVSKHPYSETIDHTLLQPLGMTSSGFDVEQAPPERRALGYRWENDAWRIEPTLGPGAFGAMGGLQTSATDYARWVAYLLSAWPARDGTDAGPVQRGTVRELAQGSNFPRFRNRPARTGMPVCRQAFTYGMGMFAAMDCDLGFSMSHGGGYPGYGSYVLLLPDRGIGIFAFANRTYAGTSAPVWDAAIALAKAGQLGTERALPVSADLASAYRSVGTMFAAGSVAGSSEQLAMNFLFDRDAEGWSRELQQLKSSVGDCDTNSPVEPTGALSGDFTWTCAHGRLSGSLLLAPTRPARIQAWKLQPIVP
jgi:CubicO group peptidase (beta-lactamase class C family)